MVESFDQLARRQRRRRVLDAFVYTVTMFAGGVAVGAALVGWLAP